MGERQRKTSLLVSWRRWQSRILSSFQLTPNCREQSIHRSLTAPQYLWGRDQRDGTRRFSSWQAEGQWAKPEQEHFRPEAFPCMDSPAVKQGPKEDVQSHSLEFFKTWLDKGWVSSKLKYPSVLLFLRILSHVCKEDWAWLQGGSRPGHLQGQWHPRPSAAEGTLQMQAPWQTSVGCTSSPIIMLCIHHWTLRVGRPCQCPLCVLKA